PAAAGEPPVSLLLDALKRAEQEKLARQAERAAAEAAAEPAAEATPPAGRSRLELEGIDASRAAPAAAAASVPGERANAQKVFAAKIEPAQAARSRTPLIAAAALVVLLISAGGAYVWYQVSVLGGQRPYAARTSAGVYPFNDAPPP